MRMRFRIYQFSIRFGLVLAHRRKLRIKKEKRIRQLRREVVQELQFHPIFIQNKLDSNDNNLEAIFLEYGY